MDPFSPPGRAELTRPRQSPVEKSSGSAQPSAGELAHYRRERELASLYATARSLTALGQVDDVLQSIVRHAHELIGTDFAYLSLVGNDGDLSIRASEGTISSAFKTARIPHGTGLGGKVIASRTPLWVRDYLAARQVRHDADFDGLVDQEGMVALLGVPLVVRGAAIGALFAADRRERAFSADEIALFSAFADHAAVALDNARLYDESRSALESLQAAYRVIERSQSVHEALTQVVLTGGGRGEVAQQLADLMGGAVTVLDRDGSVLTRRGPDASARPDLAATIEQARRTGRCVTASDEPGVSHCVAAIQAGDSYLGALTWTVDGRPAPVDLRILERATHIVGLLVLKENAVVDAAERLSGELLTDLLVGSPALSPTQRARTRARGVDVDALNLVIVAGAVSVATPELSRRLHTVAQERAGLAGEYLGRATLVVHSAGPGDDVTGLHRRLRRELGRPVTVVGELVRGHDWARGFSLANRCTSVLHALGKVDTGATTAQYALYGMLFDVERGQELDRFVADSLGPLIEYDRRRSTDLVGTLGAYHASGANLARTARTLHIHQNTLLKRLERVSALLGEGWRGPDGLQLQVALRLHELRAALDGGGPS